MTAWTFTSRVHVQWSRTFENSSRLRGFRAIENTCVYAKPMKAIGYRTIYLNGPPAGDVRPDSASSKAGSIQSSSAPEVR